MPPATTADPASLPPDARILVFERGMLRPRRRKPVHGVELFRLRLLKALAELGLRITLLAERSWGGHVRQLAGDAIRLITSPYLVRARPTGAVLARRAIALAERETPFDVLLLGDPDHRQVGAIRGLMDAGVAGRTLIMAHGRGRGTLVRALDDRPYDVHAVSEHVADEFRGEITGRLSVGYGIAGADPFLSVAPACDRERADNEQLRVCLLARLPSVSKGEATIREAWSLLPEVVRARCELHLAGYLDPPNEPEPSISAHPWVPHAEVPAFLASMHVLAVPSTNESFCQSMVQGMLAGLPVLASPLPVLAEKLDAGGGLVCAQPWAYAAGIEAYLEDDALRRADGGVARRVALARYVWETPVFARTVLGVGVANTPQA